MTPFRYSMMHPDKGIISKTGFSPRRTGVTISKGGIIKIIILLICAKRKFIPNIKLSVNLIIQSLCAFVLFCFPIFTEFP